MEAAEVLSRIKDLLSNISDTSSVPEPNFVPCEIKSLPARLASKAAKTAVSINPANRVSFQNVAGIMGDTVFEPAKIALLTEKYWGPSPRQLTVSFMEKTPSDLRARIVQHFNAWTKTGCISFVETAGVGQVRVSRGQGGYYSYLGTDILHIPRNRQTMNLEGFTMETPESEFRRVVRHECAHSLGMPHEHMRRQLIARLDRQKTYTYFQVTQGWDQSTVDSQVLTPLEEFSIRATPDADQDSIMCYQLPGEITVDGRPIRGGVDINALDYEFCGKIYPLQSAPPQPGPTCNCGHTIADNWSESEDIDAVIS